MLWSKYLVTLFYVIFEKGTLFPITYPNPYISLWFASIFQIWFAPAPLLPEIRDYLGLSKADVWNSSITNDIVAALGRVIIGPICDNYAARIPMSVILVLGAIPCAMVGFVKTSFGLSAIRFFIGVSGSSFVMAQFWPSRLFSQEISGTANGIVGGWGNLGGAFTQLLMGTFLFPAFQQFYDDDTEKTLKTIFAIPAGIAILWALVLPHISDDAPMGNYSEMKKKGSMDRIFYTTSLRSGMTMNTWVLYIQYAASFGVELVMNNAAVLYFSDEFGLSTKDASTIGFCYGSMNIFARALGGLTSDRLNMRLGMRGRLWLVSILLILEGSMILVFSFVQSLVGAILVMCIFSIFTQAAEGAIYGVVPYVSKLYTGSVSGFVGSGGNVGSIIYGCKLLVSLVAGIWLGLVVVFLTLTRLRCVAFPLSVGFRSLPYRDAFLMMACIVIASSFLSVFIDIPLHAGLLRGEDNLTVVQARERYRRHRGMVDASRHSTSRYDSQRVTNREGSNISSVTWRSPEEVDELNNRSVELGNAANYTEPKGSRSESSDIVPES
jgi:NNP family nitrate/nitrite transporter-like MFS transporter